VALTLASPVAPARAAAGGAAGGGGQEAAGCEGALESSVWYRCRKCRTPIFSEAMLEPHEEEKGQTAFEYRRLDPRVGGGLGCTSHFLHEKAQRGQGGYELLLLENSLEISKIFFFFFFFF